MPSVSKKTRSRPRKKLGDLSVRKVELADIPILRAWYSDEESRHQLYAPPEDETEFAYYMLQPHRFMILRAGIPVATFKIEEQGSAAVLGVLVAPENRGQGLGGKALCFAEEAARSLGFHVLSVDIYSDNQAAIKAFVHAGFREFIWYEKNI